MPVRAPSKLETAATSDRRLLTRSSVTLVSRAFAKSAQIIFLVVAGGRSPSRSSPASHT